MLVALPGFFFNKGCKLEDGNVAISLFDNNASAALRGGQGDGCVRLILSIDHRSTHSSCLFNHWCM